MKTWTHSNIMKRLPALSPKTTIDRGKGLTRQQRFALSRKDSEIIVVKEMSEQARYLRGEPIGV